MSRKFNAFEADSSRLLDSTKSQNLHFFMLNYPDTVATLLIVKLGLLDRCQKSNLPNHTLPGKKEVDLTLKILIIHNKIWFSKFAKIFSKKKENIRGKSMNKKSNLYLFSIFRDFIFIDFTYGRIFSKIF